MEPYYEDDLVTLHQGPAVTVAAGLSVGSVRTVVTSPPYFGLRDYGHADQIGAEASVGDYVQSLVETFAAIRPSLATDGTLWVNLGDSYATDAGEGRGKNSAFIDRSVAREQQNRVTSRVMPGLNRKNLLGVPWRVAFALQADGWILRSEIIWAKPNAMPESVTDRPTKAHEHLFLFAKSSKYYFDADSIREPVAQASVARESRARSPYEAPGQSAQRRGPKFGGNKYGDSDATESRTKSGNEWVSSGTVNKRTVWTVPTVPFTGAHFATYPPALIRPCILAGSARGDTVLDPFSGSGTTGMVATQEGRRYVGIDVNSDYLDLSLRTRFSSPVLDLTGGLQS